ncbi:MAG TPA: hypothetical protein O0X76_01190, partial [Methanocorpusculum sp.]|nr:hypothetical protein [Methanocorpusculum sp.]
AGEEVPALLTVPREELERTVLIAGVYDPVLDVLAETAMSANVRVRCGNFSGLSGLLLLMKNCCHAVCITDEADLDVLGDQKVLVRPFGRASERSAVRIVFREEMEKDPLMQKLFLVMDAVNSGSN